jgi:hypothetical protein
MSERIALSSIGLNSDNELAVDSRLQFDAVDVDEYSRFKYGDGNVAQRYGRLMGRQVIQAFPDLLDQKHVHVTSSAFKVAPPASSALLEPFLDAVNSHAKEVGSDTTFLPLRIHRANLTNGDYATMTIEEREAIVARNGLSLQEGVYIRDQPVLALDDIYVTGSHERSIEHVLSKNDAGRTIYSYILEAQGGKSQPKIEALINGSAIKAIDDIIALTHNEAFTPNARLCKYILSQSIADIERFVSEAPAHVRDQVVAYAVGDELHAMSSYSQTFHTLVGTNS